MMVMIAEEARRLHYLSTTFASCFWCRLTRWRYLSPYYCGISATIGVSLVLVDIQFDSNVDPCKPVKC